MIFLEKTCVVAHDPDEKDRFAPPPPRKGLRPSPAEYYVQRATIGGRVFAFEASVRDITQEEFEARNLRLIQRLNRRMLFQQER